MKVYGLERRPRECIPCIINILTSFFPAFFWACFSGRGVPVGVAPVGVADDDIAQRLEAEKRGICDDVRDTGKNLHCLYVTARNKGNRI